MPREDIRRLVDAHIALTKLSKMPNIRGADQLGSLLGPALKRAITPDDTYGGKRVTKDQYNSLGDELVNSQ